MPVKISAWKCEFCSRYRINKASITRHEEICFSNPDRKILEGQLAVFSTLPNELKMIDSYGVPTSDWEEPIWNPDDKLSEKYKWWPRSSEGEISLGYVCKNGKWVKMEGYKPPSFAPGFSWVEEFIPDIYN